jgi:hypothetical protein
MRLLDETRNNLLRNIETIRERLKRHGQNKLFAFILLWIIVLLIWWLFFS